MPPKDLVVSPSDTPTPVRDLWDRSDRRSILNLVPNSVGEAMILAAQKEPDLFGLDEKQLYQELRRRNAQPSPTDNRLRLSFWLEYDRAQSELRQINMPHVFGGVCTKQYFYGPYIACAPKLAWLLCPPVSYTVKIEEALDYGLDRLRDILSMEVQATPGGPVNLKLAELQAKIVAMLDQRSKGAVTQRIEQRNMNLNISSTDKQVAQAALENSMEAMDKRLKELDRRERASLNLPINQEKSEPLDVESSPHDVGGDLSP